MKFAFGALVFLFGSTTVNAAEIYLKDGSVVIGNVRHLADGEELRVKTEYMDTVTIEWDAIDEIRGTRAVDVELFSGKRVLGNLVLNEDGLSIIGEDTLTVQVAEVFAIDEVNDTFFERLEANTDLGMNIIRGNNQVTQISFGGGVGYNARNFETAIDGTTIINEQTDTEDTRRATMSGSYTQKFRNNWTGNALLQFETDDQQNLKGRSLIGGAVGKRIYNRRRTRVDLYGGLALNAEHFTGEPRTTTPEALLGTTYRLRAANGIEFDATLLVFPNLETSGRVRAHFDSTLSFDLFSDLDFKLIFYDRYDSRPPAGNKKNDSGLTLGLSWSY